MEFYSKEIYECVVRMGRLSLGDVENIIYYKLDSIAYDYAIRIFYIGNKFLFSI